MRRFAKAQRALRQARALEARSVFVISSDPDSTLTEYETEGGEDEQQEIYMMSSALPATSGDDAHVEPQTTRAGVDNDMLHPGLARHLRFLSQPAHSTTEECWIFALTTKICGSIEKSMHFSLEGFSTL